MQQTANNGPIGLPEYADAARYDIENVWAADDDFYLDLAKQIGGPVLDVACGTGRLTRAIAEAGIDVVGTDVTLAMLERARQKQPDLGIEWIHADCRTMALGRQFQLLVMTAHAFQHMLTDDDIASFLQRAQAHVIDGGTLAFETRVLANRTYITSPEWQPAGNTTLPDGSILANEMRSVYDQKTSWDTIDFRATNQTSGESDLSQTILRYIPQAELNAMLATAGFDIEAQYGFWDKSPYGEDSKELITLCRKR